jgi:hypothetical protein
MPKMRQQEASNPILSLRRAQRQRRKQLVKQFERIHQWLLRLHSTHLRLPLTVAVVFLP